MNRDTRAKTSGEHLFEEYLLDRGIRWKYEREALAGVARPDYELDVLPPVLVEIKDFDESDEDRHLRRTNGFRGIDPYRRIRNRIDKAKKQFKDHKDRGLACILVLHRGASLVDLNSEIIAGAMHGDLGFSVRVGDVEMDVVPRFDPAKAKLREELNTTISGVAVVERFKPHEKRMNDEVIRRVSPPTDASLPTEEVIRGAIRAMEAVRAESPEIDFDLIVPRVRVIHNPHARVRLDAAVFSGPHDEHLLAQLARLNIPTTEGPAE